MSLETGSGRYMPEKVAEKGEYSIYQDIESIQPSSSGKSTLPPDVHTKRVLNSRQVQLFAIGGTIGTSIFVAIGAPLVKAGPLSLLLAYTIWCTVMFCVNEGQAEMVCLLPIESSFNRFASRYVDRAFGAATGWNYFVCMTSLLCFEVTAFTAVVQFWSDDVHPVVFPAAMLTAYGVLNLWSAKFFGETEFWISLMKVILITGLLIMTFLLMVGVNPQHDAFGFRYWRNPGPMAEYLHKGDLGRFEGFVACLLSAGFAVAGPDMLSIIAGETKAPRTVMPKAFRTVFVRLILFFVLGSLAVGILVPYNDPILREAIAQGKPGAARSPYVAALTRLGVPVLPHIINGAILTSIFSAVLDWFINIATSSQLVTWMAMSVTYLRWRAAMKAQGISDNILPYKSKFLPYGSWYALILSTLVTLVNGYYVFLPGGWAAADFVFAYGSVFIFLGVYIFWKLLKRDPFVKPHDADLISGKKEIDEYEASLEDVPPATRWQRISRWLF
ncbi:hypothetical protein FRC02_009117 [Tulasnella sp. 418]|nr:hypothetical protein FRC02_009117 [Tulasnella sp. 418]